MHKKIIALITLLLFSVNSIVYASPELVYRIGLPTSKAKITRRWRAAPQVIKPNTVGEGLPLPLPSPKNNNTIIIVEDAHSNFGVQKNISEIIIELLEELKADHF